MCLSDTAFVEEDREEVLDEYPKEAADRAKLMKEDEAPERLDDWKAERADQAAEWEEEGGGGGTT